MGERKSAEVGCQRPPCPRHRILKGLGDGMNGQNGQLRSICYIAQSFNVTINWGTLPVPVPQSLSDQAFLGLAGSSYGKPPRRHSTQYTEIGQSKIQFAFLSLLKFSLLLPVLCCYRRLHQESVPHESGHWRILLDPTLMGQGHTRPPGKHRLPQALFY